MRCSAPTSWKRANIGDPAVLLEIADKLGLSSEARARCWSKRTFKDAVDRDWALSRQLGVTGVPTFVAGGYGVVGAQPYETLERLVEKAASEENH